MPEMDFHEKLLLMIIDKALIGLLIGLLVFSANIVLEKFKSNLVWKSEIEKQRIASISEVWKSFYLFNKLVNDEVSIIERVMRTNQDKDKYEDELNKIDSVCHDMMNKAIEAAEENRFWIAEEYYDFIEFQHSIMRYRKVIQEIISTKGGPKDNPELANKLVNAAKERDRAMGVVFDFVKR